MEMKNVFDPFATLNMSGKVGSRLREKQMIKFFFFFSDTEQHNEAAASTEKPQYCPTPLSSSADYRPAVEPAKKKPKLEYIPLPAIKSRNEYNPGAAAEEKPAADTTEPPPPPTNGTHDKENEFENKDKEKIGEEEIVEVVKQDPPPPAVVEEKEKPKEKAAHSRSSSRSSTSHKSKHKSSRSSSSSHKKSSSSSSHKSSREKEKKSSSSSRSSKSKSKDKEKDRERHKHKEKSKEKEKKSEKPEKPKEKKLKSPSPDVHFSESEDDVMEQCKAIFEEYTPSSTNGKQEEQKPAPVIETPEDEDVSRKRVARDGATKPLLQVPQRNLKLNPMQQIYNRQEAMRKSLEAKVVPAGPPVPIKARPSIAPVSNMLAFKYAKAKIDALKARSSSSSSKVPDQQPSTSKTCAQTASKFYGRTAHAVVAAPATQPAPPVLEPASTKISYNIRMQYYNMMVKHCLIIYPSVDDAWNRAQVEELGVMKKCNTANIYKSSALLTVNKLRKEALDSGNKTDEQKTISHDLILAGKSSNSWSVNKKLKSDKSQVSVKLFLKIFF